MKPLEWVDVLDKRLSQRCCQIRIWNDYYDGLHPLVFATAKFREAFGGMFSEFSDNWCETVVNARAERLSIVGFRFGDSPDADKDAWRIWQANHMDVESNLAIKSSIIDARSFIMVWPNDKDPLTPIMSVESAEQCIVAYEPGSRYLRRAALKRWCDEWTGEVYATLYTPDAVYKYRQNTESSPSIVPVKGKQPDTWLPRRIEGEDWPLKNPIGVVPIVEIVNNPRVAREPRSVIATVIPLQNVCNKLMTDMVVSSEYTAFRQKWATGIDIPVDPDTNQPIDTLKQAMDRFITGPPAEPGEEPVRFGTFEATDPASYTKPIDLVVGHVASQTRTPPHYLNTSADRLSGESIKSAETGLVAVVRDMHSYMGEGFEEVERLAFLCMKDPRAYFVGAEVIWRDPETRSEAEHMDALVKKKDIKVPYQQLWSDAGYSPQTQARFRAMLAEEELMFGAPEPATPDAPAV